MKKSVRRTVGSLLLATSLVVGVIPVGGVSADSSGIYQGSTVAKAHAKDSSFPESIEIDDITDDTPGTKIEPVDPSLTEQKHFGGFPIIREETFGGKTFYVIADGEGQNGYNGVPRPVYSLSKNKLNIEYYFEDNNGDEYLPPSGKLNLSIGYVDGKIDGDETEKRGNHGLKTVSYMFLLL